MQKCSLSNNNFKTSTTIKQNLQTTTSSSIIPSKMQQEKSNKTATCNQIKKWPLLFSQKRPFFQKLYFKKFNQREKYNFSPTKIIFLQDLQLLEGAHQHPL